MTTDRMKTILEEQIELLANLNKESTKNAVNTELVGQNILTIISAIDFLEKF